MSLGKILARLRKDKGYSQAFVAEFVTNMSDKTCSFKVVSHWENSVSSPTVEQFLLLCELYDVENIQWTFRNAGEQFGTSPKLNQLGRSRVEEYISLLLTNPMFSDDSVQRQQVGVSKVVKPDVNGEAETERNAETERSAGVKRSTVTGIKSKIQSTADALTCAKTIRLYTIPAAAGAGTFLDGDHYVELEIDETVPSEADFALRVSGDSMEPRFYDGQVIFVKEQASLERGEIGIFSLNGDSFVKKLGRGELLSLNPRYSPIKIGELDSLYVFGKVVG